MHKKNKRMADFREFCSDKMGLTSPEIDQILVQLKMSTRPIPLIDNNTFTKVYAIVDEIRDNDPVAERDAQVHDIFAPTPLYPEFPASAALLPSAPPSVFPTYDRDFRDFFITKCAV